MMIDSYFPKMSKTVRIKKMPSACWVVDLVSDDGTLVHPLEAFVFSLCNGKYDVDTIKDIYAATARKDKNLISSQIDSVLKKLERYLEFTSEVCATKERYDPVDYLYDPKPGKLTPDGRFDAPGEMTLILTHACNFRCIYCFNSSGNITRNELSTAEWLRVIDQAKVMEVVKCTVSGGEPMVHPGFFEILTKLVESEMSVYLCTNGSLIDQMALTKLTALEIPCVQISLDAASAAVHDQMTAVSDTFSQVIKAIEDFVKHGTKVFVKSVLTPLNVGETGALIDLCHQLGVKRLTLDRFDLSNAGRGNERLFMSREQELDLAVLVAQKDQALNGEMELMAVTDPRCWASESDIIPCGAFQRSLNILPNGDISVCEKLIDVPEMTGGNVRESSLEEIWVSERVKNIIKPAIEKVDGSCKECEHLQKCHTGCYAIKLYVDDNVYAMDPRCWKANYANNPYKISVG